MEVVIAASLLATSLAALAELFVISVRNNAAAGYTTVASAMASQKIEQLRSVGSLLTPSSSSLQSNVDGYVEFLGPDGGVLGSHGVDPPDGTAYVRRWSIEPLADGTAVLVQVLVTRRRARGAADEGFVMRAPEEARIASIIRQAP